jgi:hypothetical protein
MRILPRIHLDWESAHVNPRPGSSTTILGGHKIVMKNARLGLEYCQEYDSNY